MDADEQITLIIADDHELFRRGLRDLLSEQGFDVVAEASDGPAAVAGVRETAPDVAIMDIHMPEMTGIEATRRIREIAPTTRVLMLTVSPTDADVSEAVMAGASGYLLKEATPAEIVAAIRAVAAGESLLSPRIAATLLERIRGGEDVGRDKTAGSILTDRERTVLRLLADGRDNGAIAAELVISVQTVKNHISNILAKLEVQNRVQAAVRAVREGLV